ncbi:syntenin-1-like [Planococcus citri]|uniref:syntenin-1-like n=1 Tax=Planococcus citri TaxID=170843 RepID=UPI0031F8EBEE
MSLYPSFDQLKISDDHILQKPIEPVVSKTQSTETAVAPFSKQNGSLYPVLSEYMGLDISDTLPKDSNALVKPSMNLKTIEVAAVPGQVTHGLRRLTLCKDAKGRVGLLVSAINNGIFVCFVLKDSPAAMGGLRFGDQILQINDTLLAGYTADKVHSLIKKCSVNNINFIVRDRPFERTVTMQKDSFGRLGFEYKKGKITALVKDSSAARNGLVTDHNLLEIQGQNVIGMTDKEMSKIIETGGQVVTVTIIPSNVYDQMMKKMREDYVKAKMDHSAHA